MYKVRTKSDTHPSELFTAEMQLKSNLTQKGETIQTCLNKMRSYSLLIWAVAVVQYRTGARVTEVLKLLWSDEFAPDNFIIKGLKGSRSFEFYAPELRELYQYRHLSNGLVFGNLNRGTVHRAYVKFGLMIHNGVNKRNTTTHIFRKKKASKINTMGITREVQSDLLKHNSKKTLKYYVPE